MAYTKRENITKQKLLNGEIIKDPEINRVFDTKVVETLASVGYDC